MTDNRTTELESLSKLKMAGKLRYWRGTIEIPETELHAICDEIQAEHDQAIAATLGEQIVRCRDCKHATISTMGVCKYCEMFVLPDVDGYGADPQVNLPLDFFCGFAERKEANEDER